MAEEPGKDRSLAEIKERIERSRYESGSRSQRAALRIGYSATDQEIVSAQHGSVGGGAAVLWLDLHCWSKEKKEDLRGPERKKESTGDGHGSRLAADRGKICGRCAQADRRQLRDAEDEVFFRRSALKTQMVTAF